MKCIVQVLLLFNLLITSCAEHGEAEKINIADATKISVTIPDRTVEKSLANYDRKTSLWSLNDERYSGYLVSYYEDGTFEEKIGILNGKIQNQSTKWYPDGHLKEVTNYHEGKLHGEKKLWSTDANHILLRHLNYHEGKAHGEQRQWYPTGEFYKKLNLQMGREQGIQQAFRKNGELYANYEAKEGRIFGLKKASLCYGLEDENINYEK